MSEVKTFRVEIPDAAVERILTRVREARFPGKLGDGGWSYGVSYNYMKELAAYWTSGFDWHQAQAELNRYPQFITRIEGPDTGDESFNIHFYHVKADAPGAMPILFTHGWPGSVFEFLHLIERLTHPERFGGNPEDAFDVVIPSLPGFGFSSAPTRRAVGPITTARLWHRLMTQVLGYKRFGAQGGDWGALVTVYLAHEFPDSLKGIHLNLVPTNPIDPARMSEEERQWQQAAAAYMEGEFDYFGEQSRKPQTVAFALADNPLGMAGWILEKFKVWSDCGEDIESTFTKDQLLTNLMIYALTGTIDSSVWFYRGWAEETQGRFHPGEKITVPTATALFPKELLNQRPPRSLAERDYNLVQWTEMPKGGHFASLEQPEIFLADVVRFFGRVR